MRKNNIRIGNHSQQGVVLVVSLVILLVMTLIGISAMKVTGLEEKMAGNSRNMNLAFQAAESALREAEKALATGTLPVFNNTNGYYKSTSPQKWKTLSSASDWADATKVVVYAGDTLSGVNTKPAYIIEELSALARSGTIEAGVPGVVRYYRITARGTGSDNNSTVMLQSVFRR